MLFHSGSFAFIRSETTLAQEFHADHVKVVQALMDLRKAIQAREGATLDGANRLVGPHFKFEGALPLPAS